MVKGRNQSKERQLTDQPVKKERRTVSMKGSRIVVAVWMMVLTVTAFTTVPIRSMAQVNTYDESFDGIARRYGYYRAFDATTTNSADASSQNSTDPARGAEADAARWVAIGESFAKFAQTSRERGAAADAARWVAIGESFAKLAGTNPEQGAAADAARWVAIGESFAKFAQTSRERGAVADAARWMAMAEYYTHLALQNEVSCQGNTC